MCGAVYPQSFPHLFVFSGLKFNIPTGHLSILREVHNLLCLAEAVKSLTHRWWWSAAESPSEYMALLVLSQIIDLRRSIAAYLQLGPV